MIRFKCPGCGNILQAQPTAAGKNAKCGKCKTVMKVPAAAKPKQPSAGAAPTTSRPPAHPTKPTSTPPARGQVAPVMPSNPLAGPPTTPTDGLFDGLPEFAAPQQPVAQPAAANLAAASPSEIDLGDALSSATASINAAVQGQLQRNKHAVSAKLTPQQVIKSFGAQIQPIERSASYGASLKRVAMTMLLLPSLLAALVVGGTLVMGYIFVSWLQSEATGELLNPFIVFGFIAIVVLLLAAWIPVLNMLFAGLAMLFSGEEDSPGTRPLTREDQPVLYEFVDQICQKLDAPTPKRIDLDCQYNASASFDGGWLGFKKNELVLTLGVPLIASHSTEQLASVIAHEFGHFCQGGGMRAHYLIRHLNGWFINAAINKTIRDEVNAYVLSNSEHGAGFIWAISYVIGFLGRHMMWWCGIAGHAVSGGLSREMEYDADKYAVHLAGSKAFAASMTQVEKFAVAYSVTIDNLKMMFEDGIMIDNIPRFMLHIGKTMPGSVVRKIVEASAKEKEEAMDTHPPTRDRIRAAKELNQQGIVHVDRPAKDLVDHWADLCKAITLSFYCQVTRHKITSQHVTKLEDVLRAEHKLLLDKAD